MRRLPSHEQQRRLVAAAPLTLTPQRPCPALVVGLLFVLLPCLCGGAFVCLRAEPVQDRPHGASG